MKVLILEDDTHIAETLLIYLDSISVVACYSHTIEGFIHILPTFEPVIVFIDLLIESTISVEAIVFTKTFNPKIKVVVFTGLSDAYGILNGYKVDHILYKPFNIIDLDDIILKHSIDKSN